MDTATDYARLSVREADARNKELDIELLPVRDISTLDFESLTVGQLVKLADVIEAFGIIHDAPTILGTSAVPRPASSPTMYAPPSAAERRSSGDDAADEREARERLAMLIDALIDPDKDVQTANGPIKYRDIPRDDDGRPLDSWVDENCMCDEHKNKREDAENQSGLYL